MTDIEKSIIQKLKNKSRESKLSFQLILQLFCQEEFLRRLSQSEYKNDLILKGGLFLFSITNFESRPTMDIDFLMRNQSNENEKMLNMVSEIINEKTGNDFIEFSVKSIQSITEYKEYHGVRIKMIGLIGNTKTPFDVDFGVGDIVIPEPKIRELSVQLDEFTNPEIMTYSLESTVAEKWDAIIDRMHFNSRMKDFYDIYFLANHYDFEGAKLQKAISETLNNRGREYDEDRFAKVKLLIENKQILVRWNAFAKNTIKEELSFKIVLDSVLNFIEMPFEAIYNNDRFCGNWNAGRMEWHNN